MANSPVCSCHDEPAVAGIYVAFSPNIADVFCSYLVECVCFEPVWCRSESTCIRLGDVSVPTKAYAQQRLWSCHDCWVCLVVRAGCAKQLFMQVSFFWSSSIRVIYVCVCVCTVSAHAFCVACFYLLLLLFSQWALRRSSASCVVWWKCSVVFVFSFGQDHKLFLWLVFDEAGSWLVITVITIVCVCDTYNYWLVVWNLDFIFPYIGNNYPNWLSYFSEGLKPPTRK